jgi:aspartate aminotransferase
MKLSARMSRLGTETAFEVLARAKALEAKGVDVVHLEIGEPDFDTPRNICDAAIEAINKGYTHYTTSQGLPELRTEIAKSLGSTRSIAIDPDRIVVTTGAKPIMFYSILALLSEGDEAIYQDPLFPIYESMINFSGATAVPIPLREELGFRMDIDELRSKVTPRTKLIIINSPQNPSGGVMEEEDIRAIADIAREHDIIVLSDEIYDYIMYEGKNYSIASQPGMLDRTILLNGFSKTYAMTGWRMGYGFFPAELVEHIVRLVTNSTSCAPPIVQYACIEALRGPQDSVPKMVEELKKRRDLIVEGLNEIPGISCHRPKGAFYAFPNIKKLGMSSAEFSDYLLNKAGVASLPGTSFGKSGEGYMRMSYATSQKNIKKALERIETAVAKL